MNGLGRNVVYFFLDQSISQQPMAWNNYTGVLRKYTVFEGRAPRGEYWWFFLFNLLIMIGLTILDETIFGSGETMGVLTSLYTLAVLLPSLAVGVRRLHDTGHSGWWLLLSLVPLLGGIVLLIFMVLDGTPGANAYGADPKGRQAAQHPPTAPPAGDTQPTATPPVSE